MVFWVWKKDILKFKRGFSDDCLKVYENGADHKLRLNEIFIRSDLWSTP